MDYEIVEVSPEQLRFTQDSIADHFKLDSGRECRLEDALCDLGLGQLDASDFPLIAVASDEDGVLWSNDNRRLWLFRKARVSEIEVKYYDRPLFRAPPEPHLRELMARKDYFPRVRWRDGCKPNIRMLRSPPLPFKVEQESEKTMPYSSASEKRYEAVKYVDPHSRKIMAGEDYFPRSRMLDFPPLPSKVEQESVKATPYSSASEKQHEAVKYAEPHSRGALAGGDYFSRIRTLKNPPKVEQESEKATLKAVAFLPSGGEKIISSSREVEVQQVRQPTWPPPSSTNSSETPCEDVTISVAEGMKILRMWKIFGGASN
ncbi:hypothetical protein SUGI_0798200 [Cryptomeria japonica]|nr:hypothetical protein SUGI_0798200 [Cryptomeria japonica]